MTMSSLGISASEGGQKMIKIVRDGKVTVVPEAEVLPTDERFVSRWKNFRRRWSSSYRLKEHIGKWYHISRGGRRMFIPATELRDGDAKVEGWFEGSSPPFPGQHPRF